MGRVHGMNNKFLNKNILIILKKSLVYLPCPSNLNIWWTFGSISGVCLVVQLVRGLILAAHYEARIRGSFYRVAHIIKEVNIGWFLRNCHVAGARLFFLCVYTHIGRRVYYGGYENYKVWFRGILMLFLLIAIAFMGYVLPWGQISYWGCTVITNLFSAIPYLGKDLVLLLWGGPSIGDYTLKRFFLLHFFLPFLLLAISVLHLFFLHENGSRNPLGIRRNTNRVSFYPYYLWIDICGITIIIIILILLVLYDPLFLNVPDNWILANALVTPVHIKPEWYFLWLYAILRSIPFKLGGIVTIVLAILFLYLLPFLRFSFKIKSFAFYPSGQILFWLWVCIILCLTWIGACPVEYPFEFIGRLITFFYFIFYPLQCRIRFIWDKLLEKNLIN